MEFHSGEVNAHGDMTSVQVMACTETTCHMMDVKVSKAEEKQYSSLGSNAAAIVEKACSIVYAAVGDKVLKAKSLADLAKLAKLQ